MSSGLSYPWQYLISGTELFSLTSHPLIHTDYAGICSVHCVFPIFLLLFVFTACHHLHAHHPFFLIVFPTPFTVVSLVFLFIWSIRNWTRISNLATALITAAARSDHHGQPPLPSSSSSSSIFSILEHKFSLIGHLTFHFIPFLRTPPPSAHQPSLCQVSLSLSPFLLLIVCGLELIFLIHD